MFSLFAAPGSLPPFAFVEDLAGAGREGWAPEIAREGAYHGIGIESTTGRWSDT